MLNPSRASAPPEPQTTDGATLNRQIYCTYIEPPPASWAPRAARPGPGDALGSLWRRPALPHSCALADAHRIDDDVSRPVVAASHKGYALHVTCVRESMCEK